MKDIFDSLKTMSFDINEHDPSLRKHGIGLPHMEDTKKLLSEIQKQRWKEGKYDAEKLRLSRIGFKQPESQKQKVSKFFSRKWLLTSPDGCVQEIENLTKFCRENNLDQGNLSRGYHKGWKAQKIS